MKHPGKETMAIPGVGKMDLKCKGGFGLPVERNYGGGGV